MTTFDTQTIHDLLIHLLTKYGLIFEPLYDEQKDTIEKDYFYIDYCNEEETDYFQFIINSYCLHIESSECEYMVAEYIPSDFEDINHIIQAIDDELKFYLPKDERKNN